MKTVLTLILIICSNFSFGQTRTYSFGTGFSKSNRKSIAAKMDKLIEKISKERSCPKDSISIDVKKLYTVFYSKSSRHLPKQIDVSVCGKLVRYKHEGLSGALLYWLLGSWVEVK